MEDTTAFARENSFLDRLGPVVIRASDPPVSVNGSGGGVLMTGAVPREPVPEALLEKARERMRELANSPPAAPPEQKP
jgi:hypothetical protein